jgi:hypothetical protein
MAPLACPRCGDVDVAANELIPALALGRWQPAGASGAPQFVPAGETRVAWGARRQPVPGREAYCRACDWSGAPTDLRPAEVDPPA